jgi:pimeloyl-ACP methyl ester carboxylesterase
MSIAIFMPRSRARYRSMNDKTEGGRYGPDGRSAWLDVDWREHQHWVMAWGCPVNVIEVGEGPPIVFVHGLGGSWQNWLEQLPVFAAEHRCVAFDLPGFGASPRPEEEISIPGYGALVRDLLARIGIDRAVVVGNSMGGFVACELAVQHPDAVERLVLISAAGISSEQLHRRPLITGARMSTMVAEWVGSRADRLAARPRARTLLLSGIFRHPSALPAPLIGEQMRGSGKPGFIDAFDALMSYRIRDRLGEIRAPTLVVWGTGDRLVPLKDADEFVRLIPDAEKLVFEDTGHTPQLERPAAFNEALRAFVTEEAPALSR